MNELQFEELERWHSEDAARSYFTNALPGEDECIVLCKASEALDAAYPGWFPDRKGLERFSLLLVAGDDLMRCVREVQRLVTDFEDALFERDAQSLAYA